MHGGIQLQLQGRRLKWFIGGARPSSLGPVGRNVVGAAGPVGDPPVERLDRKAARGVAGDQGVKPPPQAIHLDDISSLYALEPHRLQG